MPLDDYDRPSGTNRSQPALGDWGTEPEPNPESELDYGVELATPEPELDYDPATVPVVYPVALWCRRCGESAEPVAGRCPWCGTWTDGEPPPAKPVYSLDEEDETPEDDWHTDSVPYAIPVRRPHFIPPIVVVVVAYFAMLGVSVMFLVYAASGGAVTQEDVQTGTAIVELIDTALTIVALIIVWSSARQRVPEGTTAITWVSAFPVLFALLCMNILFVTFLRELLRPLGAPDPERMKMTALAILLICVQPAIVEELFFRQMTLGVLRKSMNMHLAVWITAAVFAFAHLFNPFGMPYLFLVGGFLGYARVFGGLTLAMVLHFVHNFVVIAYEAWK